MHVVSQDGKKLFSGSRHDCKQFMRKNKLNRAEIKSVFAEKSVVVEPVIEEEEETPETFFNTVFE